MARMCVRGQLLGWTNHYIYSMAMHKINWIRYLLLETTLIWCVVNCPVVGAGAQICVFLWYT